MRTTSSVTDTEFPFAEDSTAFILVYAGSDGAGGTEIVPRGFGHASTFDKKRGLIQLAKHLQEAAPNVASLLAVWPGATRSDVFLVDDLDEALAAFS